MGIACYHDSLPLHVDQQGVSIPLRPVLHILGKNKSLPYTFQHFPLTIVSLGPYLVCGEKNFPAHHKFLHVG